MIDVVRPCGTWTLVRLRGYTQGFKTKSKTTNEVRQHQNIIVLSAASNTRRVCLRLRTQ